MSTRHRGASVPLHIAYNQAQQTAMNVAYHAELFHAPPGDKGDFSVYMMRQYNVPPRFSLKPARAIPFELPARHFSQ